MLLARLRMPKTKNAMTALSVRGDCMTLIKPGGKKGRADRGNRCKALSRGFVSTGSNALVCNKGRSMLSESLSELTQLRRIYFDFLIVLRLCNGGAEEDVMVRIPYRGFLWQSASPGLGRGLRHA